MNRRGFFLTFAGAAAAGAGVLATSGQAEALPITPASPKAPDWLTQDAQYYYRRRRCRRWWNGYRWVVRCW